MREGGETKHRIHGTAVADTPVALPHLVWGLEGLLRVCSRRPPCTPKGSRCYGGSRADSVCALGEPGGDGGDGAADMKLFLVRVKNKGQAAG